jgi:hypothetical protein
MNFYISSTIEMQLAYFWLHFIYPAGKPMIAHLLRYQGFAVGNYSFTLAAMYVGCPRLSLN